jgi:hypothetical protein
MEAERTVIGVPGGGLVDASWAASEEVAEIGRRGELLTAAVLDRLARPGGPTVLHDLMLPTTSGVRVNVDHVVVSGRKVVLVDSKCWQLGRYWTALGRTRRGLKPVPHADKRGGVAALRDLERCVLGCRAMVVGPVYVIWPSSKSSADRLSVRWYRPAAGWAMTGRQFARKAARLVGDAPADPKIVAALVPLVASVRNGHTRPVAGRRSAKRMPAPTPPRRPEAEDGADGWPEFGAPYATSPWLSW